MRFQAIYLFRGYMVNALIFERKTRWGAYRYAKACALGTDFDTIIIAPAPVWLV